MYNDKSVAMYVLYKPIKFKTTYNSDLSNFDSHHVVCTSICFGSRPELLNISIDIIKT